MATTLPTRRAVLTRIAGATTVAGATAVAGCSGDSGTGSPDTTPTGGGTTTMTDDFTFETTSFADGGTVPREFTCDGADRSPPLTLGGVPDEADSVAILVDDPDAPGSGAFTHWLVWNVPADTTEIPGDLPQTDTLENLGGARQGTNDFGEVGYRGPCPPGGDGPHTYRFTAYAVSGEIDRSSSAEKADLEAALEGSTVGTSRFTGEYERA